MVGSWEKLLAPYTKQQAAKEEKSNDMARD
jgi:hypothetical protein